ncbi:FADS2 [Mytilus coruscus]|uniref:FADS2 n=1 Tax=Mytilus coruscus TaxID=42192 RepID=A0A6J8APM3_MYTCO|nr:FADS2 [Mytilus coruscus]
MGAEKKIDSLPSSPNEKRYISLEEVKKHNQPDDRWLLIENKVYNITNWAKKHPGGGKILGHFSGQDATDAWRAFHNDKDYVKKFMKALYVGDIERPEESLTELKSDFRELRKHVEDSGLLKTKPWFYALHLAHIILLEIFAYCLVSYYGGGLYTFIAAAIILATAQAQAGWTQHDYGHNSVFPSHKMNKIFHHIVIGHIKGASSHWWNFRHFQHHAKPNVGKKDPDVDFPYLLLLGENFPVTWGKQKKGFMPYNQQQNYFFLTMPPLLLPLYFHFENILFVFKRRDWVDLLMTVSFFGRYFYLYTQFWGAWGVFGFYMFFWGAWGVFGFYMFVRFLESHWFVWVTQMSHISMKIDVDRDNDWFTSQLVSTCNVHQGLFNDWFTGHLNFQIEHHLFPTMPRHNLHKVAPLVKSLCKKHNIEYLSLPLFGAFARLVTSLKKSGELWYDSYYNG